MTPHQTDVFIVGGGPAGLAAGIAARLRGFRVMLADGCRPPIDKACGEGLMADALAGLRRLGVSLSREQGALFTGIRFVEPGFSAEARFRGGPGLGIRRTTLHSLLVERASELGVDLHWGRPARLDAAGASVDGTPVRARWMVGADGQNSSFRRWAGLDRCRGYTRRFGFRRHFRVSPWSDFVEVHWTERCQAYITPVSADEVCVAVISRDPRLRFEDFFRLFPGAARRLEGASPGTAPRGAVTASCRLHSVVSGSFALIGEASGSLDAITGEGLSLAFRQAVALAEALERDDLAWYAAEHRRIARMPRLMERLMLILDQNTWVRHQVLRAFTAEPRLFARLLDIHTRQPAASTFYPSPRYL